MKNEQLAESVVHKMLPYLPTTGQRSWRESNMPAGAWKYDAYAVSAIKDGTFVGHLPRQISCTCMLLIRRGGTTSLSSYW